MQKNMDNVPLNHFLLYQIFPTHFDTNVIGPINLALSGYN